MLQKISTDKAPAAIGPYSQGIVLGNIFFASGQIPIDPATGEIHGTTIEEQAELVVRQILGPAAENSDKEIVVKLPVRDGESGESESSGVLSGLSSAS